MVRTRIKFKPGQIKEVVLAAIGISLVLGGSVFITPNFPIVLAGLIKIVQELKNIKIPKFKIKRVLKNLEKRKIISLEKKGEEVIVKVLDNKNVEILKYSIKKLLELKAKKKAWSKKWFLVAFDVPEGERNKRNYLRKFLTDIGFYQYQKSIYVYPYECEEEVGLIKKIVEGGEYISYIVAERLEKETELKIFFQLA
ncbi:MAG: CRISPR-associated endonuclease Cas2 [Microgenomates group bacterium]